MISSLNDFLELEVTLSYKNFLLETIEEFHDKEFAEIDGNLCSIKFYPQKNEVLIEPDIDPDNYPAFIIAFDVFYTELKKFTPKD